MKADLFETDFSQATVITMFLLPDINLKLRPKILDLKPGTRIVSNSFTMGEWTARRQRAGDREGRLPVLLHGLSLDRAGESGRHLASCRRASLTLKQSFQMITGTLKAGGKETAVKGRLDRRSDQLSRPATPSTPGSVSGDGIKGTVKSGGGAAEWSAARAGRRPRRLPRLRGPDPQLLRGEARAFGQRLELGPGDSGVADARAEAAVGPAITFSRPTRFA